MKILRKKIIYGCEERGDSQSPYLTRLTLIETKLGAAYIHLFHRSDGVEHHDHPWGFVSLILWRGYFEETPTNWDSRCVSVAEGEALLVSGQGFDYGGYGIGDTMYVHRGADFARKRVWSGQILFRHATWRHRVVLVDDKPAVTLVIRGPYKREWGFFTKKGWQQWKEYFRERGC